MPELRIWETPIYKGLVKGIKRRGDFYDWGQRKKKNRWVKGKAEQWNQGNHEIGRFAGKE